MVSKDFMNLMTKLHRERYNILSTEINAHRVGDSFLTKATIVLEKEGKQIILESDEADFILYIVELRQVADTTGEHKFTRVKDLNQYNADVEHLIDEDHSKLKKAADEIRSGKFTFTYDPPKLIDEFLRSQRNVKDKKFLPLKRDYHYILANACLISEEMLKAHKRLTRKYPEAEKIIHAVEQIMNSFRPTGNAIKDYKFYGRYVNFDIDGLAKRMSTQLRVVDDTIKGFIQRRKVDANIAIPRMMNIYGKFLELSAPVINLIRVGLELKRGNPSPQKQRILGENVKILQSDPDYGPFFGCLDEQIRHSDAHASIDIDKTARKVRLIDARGGKEKTVGIYEFDKLAHMINIMQNQFFPAVFPTLILFDIATLDLLLVSPQYKFLLLAVGNC